VEGSFRILYEAQYNDRRTMGGVAKQEAWFFDGWRMGVTGAEGTFCHTVVLGTTCLARGA